MEKRRVYLFILSIYNLVGCGVGSALPEVHQKYFATKFEKAREFGGVKLDGYFLGEYESGGFHRIIFYPNGLVVSSFIRLPDCSDSLYANKWKSVPCDTVYSRAHYYRGASWGGYSVTENRIEEFSILPLGYSATSRSFSQYTIINPDSIVWTEGRILEGAGPGQVFVKNRGYKREKNLKIPTWEHAWILNEPWFRKEFLR